MASDYRIINHPIIDFRRGRRITFYYNDKVVEAYEGESVLAALYAVGYRVFSYSPDGKRPRGAFCMIGKCSSCLSIVDGVPNTRICITPVREGMRVYRQTGMPSIPVKTSYEPIDTVELETDVLIIGGGPAGLQAALILAEEGYRVVLVDDHHKLGGQLVKQTHRFFGDKRFYGGIRGFRIAELLSNRVLENNNIRVYTQALAYGFFRDNIVGVAVRAPKPLNLLVKPRAVIGSTGACERTILFENNDLPGIMGAGAAQTLMNEYGIRPGDRALIIGSGNVGLIVAYQLLQAGVRVLGIAEILPHIGGWFVHAAKIRRLGVKIYTRHTITKAIGRDRVEKAVISMVDEKYEPIPGSEKTFDTDLILLAVGLQPNYSLFSQAGAVMKYIPEIGGLVPIRTYYMETSVPNLYIAGDASGIEEATTAFIEGEIAALSIALKLGSDREEVRRRRDRLVDYLWREYRMSPVVERARRGKLKVTVSEEEMEKIRRGELDGV